MKKIGLIYSFNSRMTAVVADKIFNEIGEDKVEKVNVENINEEIFLSYDSLIVGVPTWFDGELPNYWDEFVPALEEMDLKGKTIAIFGNGNQRDYSENFVDGIGILGDLLVSRGAKIIGETSVKGYKFEFSKAVKKGKFIGLAIDQDTQAKLTEKRVKDWVKVILKEFNKKR